MKFSTSINIAQTIWPYIGKGDQKVWHTAIKDMQRTFEIGYKSIIDVISKIEDNV